MFKKIQSHLLINYPLVWNLKLIPMLLIVVVLYLLFFCLGYFSTTIDFSKGYRYFIVENNISFYGIGVLTSLLILILWLVFYLKNNGLKVFYPKKTSSLYKEWFLSFLIIIGVSLYCFSFYQGGLMKIKSYASLEEVNKVENLLTKINFLIPDPTTYTRHYTEIKEEDKVVMENIGASISLLEMKKFNNNNYNNYSTISNQVYQWLIKEKKDSIQNTIQEYLKLQEKHNLKTNLTIDLWMKIIYNPSQYIVSSENFISKYNSSSSYFSDGHYRYFVQYNQLERGYNEIDKAYNSTQNTFNFLLTTFCIAFVFSLLLFSFRVTSGKAWLTSVVILGLLLFISGIFMAIIDLIYHSHEVKYIYPSFWIVVFLVLFIYLETKVLGRNKNKGKSSIVLNLVLWLFPFIPFLIFTIYMRRVEYIKYASDLGKGSDYCLYTYFNGHWDKFIWINLIFSIIILLFFMSQIRKWKSLPEE